MDEKWQKFAIVRGILAEFGLNLAKKRKKSEKSPTQSKKSSRNPDFSSPFPRRPTSTRQPRAGATSSRQSGQSAMRINSRKIDCKNNDFVIKYACMK